MANVPSHFLSAKAGQFAAAQGKDVVRTVSNLWPSMVSWKHLVASYNRCRKRKRYKTAASQFHYHWESNLRQLQQELYNQSWLPGSYHHFQVTDPKPRLISAAPFRDRVVHHALVGILEPYFERRFIYDSYACRVDKGTHRAIHRAQYYLRRHAWYLKTDIVKFFPSIDHFAMKKTLAAVVRDSKIMELVDRILESGNQLPTSSMPNMYFPGDNLFSALRPKGLPIGNLTSQFFANVLLDPLDHFIKEELRVPGYIRYADDLLLFGDSKEQLWEWRDCVAVRLASIRLQLHVDKTIVAQACRGLNYLGFRVFPDQRRLSQDAIRRFNRKRRKWAWDVANEHSSVVDVSRSLQASLAHLKHANSEGIRRVLMNRIRLQKGQCPDQRGDKQT